MTRDASIMEDALAHAEERIRELEDDYARLDAYCELLIDCLDDACDHMKPVEVEKLRIRHKRAMEVIS